MVSEVRGWSRACGFAMVMFAGALGAGSPPAQAEDCVARVDRQGATLRLRPHNHAALFCRIDEASYAQLLRDALREQDPAPDAEDAAETSADVAAPPEAIALGRLEEYPWLARALIDAALADPGWNTKTGRPVAGHVNDYVESQLLAPALRDRLAAPLAGSGLVITGVSVEKVLVRRVGDIVPDARSPARQVPFDAQVWLRLGRAESEAR